jgi:hypothetical protein
MITAIHWLGDPDIAEKVFKDAAGQNGSVANS